MKAPIVTPLYKREQWQRWVDLFANSDRMTLVFDEWMKDHIEDVTNYRQQGYVVHEVEVDIDGYISWARSKSLPINGATRADYPIHILAERMNDAGDFEH